ncbi:MAG: hypothetical protein K8R25_18405 [Methanosarcinales archaeon]|nr:hypothetical protein [Methanosarcinales archaeon]
MDYSRQDCSDLDHPGNRSPEIKDIHDQLILEEGVYFDLSEGIELQVLEIKVDEETVYFSLVKDGLVSSQHSSVRL